MKFVTAKRNSYEGTIRELGKALMKHAKKLDDMEKELIRLEEKAKEEVKEGWIRDSRIATVKSQRARLNEAYNENSRSIQGFIEELREQAAGVVDDYLDFNLNNVPEDVQKLLSSGVPLPDRQIDRMIEKAGGPDEIRYIEQFAKGSSDFFKDMENDGKNFMGIVDNMLNHFVLIMKEDSKITRIGNRTKTIEEYLPVYMQGAAAIDYHPVKEYDIGFKDGKYSITLEDGTEEEVDPVTGEPRANQEE